MPGPILLAKCACGFERCLSPGAHLGGSLSVIAYAANERDLVTVNEEEAQKARLIIIEDPYIKAVTQDPGGFHWGPWGPCRCPGCEQTSLLLLRSGVWD